MPFKKNKTVPISYTSRDFSSIKADLVEYARRYYPETYKDFNEGSFGSLTLDLDYQANESFLTTAIEQNNVMKLARQMGYRHKINQSSSGMVSFYISVPSDSNGTEPNRLYLPVLKKGAVISSQAGGVFTLVEDVDFAHPENETVVGAQDADSGLVTDWIVKAHGQVISGELSVFDVEIGNFRKFRS